LPSVEISLAVPLLAGAIAGLALTLGRGSAFLAAMLLLIVLRWLPGWEAALALHLLEVLALCGAGLGGAALVERVRRERAAARQAHVLMDTTVQAAAARVEQARRELAKAEARLAVLQQQAAAQLAGSRPMFGDPFEQAIRSEGGV
jgi:hypothetical protein